MNSFSFQMDDWYFLMLFSIIFILTNQVKSLNYKLFEPYTKTEKLIIKPNFNPIQSFQNRSYDSGILFEQISNVRLSDNEFQSNYNIDITKFTDRIDLLTHYKFELELYCLRLNKRQECTLLIETIQEFIEYGEETMRTNNRTK